MLYILDELGSFDALHVLFLKGSRRIVCLYNSQLKIQYHINNEYPVSLKFSYFRSFTERVPILTNIKGYPRLKRFKKLISNEISL